MGSLSGRPDMLHSMAMQNCLAPGDKQTQDGTEWITAPRGPVASGRNANSVPVVCTNQLCMAVTQNSQCTVLIVDACVVHGCVSTD